MSHYPERKARNKNQNLTDEQWIEAVHQYSVQKQSITTLAVYFKVSHEVIRSGLLSRGIALEPRRMGNYIEKRHELLPKGKFSGNSFFKK